MNQVYEYLNKRKKEKDKRMKLNSVIFRRKVSIKNLQRNINS